MNDKIKITSLTGLITQTQLSEIVSEIIRVYDGKIAALQEENTKLNNRLKVLEDLKPQLYILAKE